MGDIDSWCVNHYDDGHRNHLGASLIGGPCKRYLFYVFRWCHHTTHSGRQYRLFNRGHKEEDRFLEWLRGAGCTVYDTNPASPVGPDGKHKQYNITGVMGHFGGSLDGIGYLPPHYGINEAVLFEFKTNGTGQPNNDGSGAKFEDLKKKGMPIAKEQHFAQTSTYGYKYGFNWCVYLNICKNNDEIYLDLVKLDHNLGVQMERKAELIITSQTAPPRLSENPTHRECGWCDMKDICHEGAKFDVNCRSCKYAHAVENKGWFCAGHGQLIPVEVIKTGCQHWEAIE